MSQSSSLPSDVGDAASPEALGGTGSDRGARARAAAAARVDGGGRDLLPMLDNSGVDLLQLLHDVSDVMARGTMHDALPMVLEMWSRYQEAAGAAWLKQEVAARIFQARVVLGDALPGDVVGPLGLEPLFEGVVRYEDEAVVVAAMLEDVRERTYPPLSRTAAGAALSKFQLQVDLGGDSDPEAGQELDGLARFPLTVLFARPPHAAATFARDFHADLVMQAVRARALVEARADAGDPGDDAAVPEEPLTLHVVDRHARDAPVTTYFSRPVEGAASCVHVVCRHARAAREERDAAVADALYRVVELLS